MNALRKAYFSNTTHIEAIQRTNNDLLSDSMSIYPILKAVVHQSKANNKASSKTGRKNTFLFR